MNFASTEFLIFLPLVLFGYHLLRTRTPKYLFLLGASWLFYLLWNPSFFWVLVLPTVVDYLTALRIEAATDPRRRRFWLYTSIAINLGLLGIFKYTNFFLASSRVVAETAGWSVPNWNWDIILPLGISFHTFQGISYTIDVYQKKIPAVRSFTDFALFVAFFPQLVAGPIVRAVEFLPQMATPPRVSSEQIIEGLHWILLGFFKKVFLADRLAQFVDVVFGNPGGFDAVTHRWAVVAYAGQIYCDFSGYSDIAIGCAKWFGFELPRNFNFPYIATSITDFWKRWHISLSSWMRDYVYISLGGNRRGNIRTYLNLLATLTLCGLWHGASWNYVLWGTYNGVLLAVHRLADQLLNGISWADRLRSHVVYKVSAVACTFWLVSLGLVLVRSENWLHCRMIEWSMLGGNNELEGSRWVPTWVPLLVGLILAGHLLSGIREVRCRLLAFPSLLRAGAYVAVVALILVFGPGATKAFIYFQF